MDTKAGDIIRLRARAYKWLLAGAESLLESDQLFWTERLLLKIVRSLYSSRLDSLLGLLPAVLAADEPEERLRANLLEAQAEAAAGGHALGSWEQPAGAEGRGYQAICQRCGMSVYVSDKTRYSLLEDKCPGHPGL